MKPFLFFVDLYVFFGCNTKREKHTAFKNTYIYTPHKLHLALIGLDRVNEQKYIKKAKTKNILHIREQNKTNKIHTEDLREYPKHTYIFDILRKTV